MNYELKTAEFEGREINKLKCPLCGVWGDLDDDQLHGRISTQCQQPGCAYHETIDFSQRLKDYHVHVYQISGLAEVDVKAFGEEDARGRALRKIHSEGILFGEADCIRLALAFNPVAHGGHTDSSIGEIVESRLCQMLQEQPEAAIMAGLKMNFPKGSMKISHKGIKDGKAYDLQFELESGYLDFRLRPKISSTAELVKENEK